jgi:hypothetical protein
MGHLTYTILTCEHSLYSCHEPLSMGTSMQDLKFDVNSKPGYGLPIFCANDFTTPAQSIVVL